MEVILTPPDPLYNAEDITAGVKTYIGLKTVRGGKQYGVIFTCTADIDRTDDPAVESCKRAFEQKLAEDGIPDDATVTAPERLKPHG